MLKWNLLILFLFLGIMNLNAINRNRRAGGYARSGAYAGAGAGGYAGTDGYNGGYNSGYNGGYDGSYDFGGDNSYGFGYAPGFDGFGAGFIDPYLFHQQLTAQILAQHAAHQNAIVSTLSSANAQAWGSASMLPDNIQTPDNIETPNDAIQRQHFASQAHYGNNAHRYAPNYSVASGSVGPGGSYQTAYINPPNPGVPNIVNRFSESSPTNGLGSGGGFKGVSVSSFSSSSDVNGKRTDHRGAQTTINDNGKVTTYRGYLQ